VTDRGFYSASNSRTLQEADTFDGLCPRGSVLLRERRKEEKFARLHRRRAQTEARIGILKRNFLGRPMRAKGFEHRELALAWGVLTHNLWMLSRMRKTKRKAQAGAAGASGIARRPAFDPSGPRKRCLHNFGINDFFDPDVNNSSTKPRHQPVASPRA
jgi:Transposase DDE domain